MSAPTFFTPHQEIIAQIVRGLPTTVFTIRAHGFLAGQVVKIDIPVQRGMQQLNGYIGQATITGALTFTLPIDSTGFDPYAVIVIPVNESYCGQVIPIAEDALTLACSTINNNNILPETIGTIPINP
jgi:hypothetical protein